MSQPDQMAIATRREELARSLREQAMAIYTTGIAGPHPIGSTIDAIVDAITAAAGIPADEPTAPRTWPRLPAGAGPAIQAVRLPDGGLCLPLDDEGYYWTAPGWTGGVSWTQLLHWGPVTDATAELDQ